MAGENMTNLDGMMKDTYSKGSTSQAGKGFQKAAPHRCKSCGKIMKHSGGTMCAECAKGK